VNRHERRAARKRARQAKPRDMELVVDLGEDRPLDLMGIDTVTGEIELY
jgi:hypothetical protein